MDGQEAAAKQVWIRSDIQKQVWQALESVSDPEIPVVSVVDMGIIHRILIDEENCAVTIEALPTFIGCPALPLMETEMVSRVREVKGITSVRVQFVFEPRWTSSRITPEGKANLRRFGIAPPPIDAYPGSELTAECPYCGSPKTVLENLFGPTSCRSIMYCSHCKNPFEVMKPI